MQVIANTLNQVLMNLGSFVSTISTNELLLLVVGLLMWVYKRERDKRLRIERQLSKEKYAVYSELIGDIFATFLSRSSKGDVNMGAAAKLLEKHKDLTIYASDEVLQAFYSLMQVTQSAKGISEEELYRYCGELMFYIRKDMGHRNKNISIEDVITSIYLHTDNTCEASQERWNKLQRILNKDFEGINLDWN